MPLPGFAGTGHAADTELDASGVVAKRFVYAEGENVPELMVTSTATYLLVKDHLGSVRQVIDEASGGVAQRIEHDAWGLVTITPPFPSGSVREESPRSIKQREG